MTKQVITKGLLQINLNDYWMHSIASLILLNHCLSITLTVDAICHFPKKINENNKMHNNGLYIAYMNSWEEVFE